MLGMSYSVRRWYLGIVTTSNHYRCWSFSHILTFRYLPAQLFSLGFPDSTYWNPDIIFELFGFIRHCPVIFCRSMFFMVNSRVSCVRLLAFKLFIFMIAVFLVIETSRLAVFMVIVFYRLDVRTVIVLWVWLPVVFSSTIDGMLD